MTSPARKNRLVAELQQAGIDDPQVLSAFGRIPREAFIPAAFRDQAYEDIALPIGHGQTISQPSVVGRMIQFLEVGRRDKVLEIGTGSGYQTAVLSLLCRRVYTVERYRSLLAEASETLIALRRLNVTGRPGDGALGWPEQAPFQRIIVSAAATEVPPPLIDQLAVGGRMLIPLGERSEQTIWRVTRTADGLEYDEIGPVRFVPLVAGLAADQA